MEHLSKKEKEFVALGAAVASNCIPCVIFHIKEARKLGIGDEQIRAAVEMARAVRKVPAEQVVTTAYAQLGDPVGDEGAAGDCNNPSCCG